MVSRAASLCGHSSLAGAADAVRVFGEDAALVAGWGWLEGGEAAG